jgi:hypothetical protein
MSLNLNLVSIMMINPREKQGWLIWIHLTKGIGVEGSWVGKSNQGRNTQVYVCFEFGETSK